jgi:rubrerythrin
MGKLGAFDILKMAEQIEQDGIDFYRMAATKFDDDALRDLFTQLASWEVNHREAFAEMRCDLLEQLDMKMRFDEASYVTSNPQVLQSLASHAIKGDPEEELSKVKNKVDALELALKRETDAISFFRSLVDYLRDLPAKKRVKAILEEEKKHVNILTQSIQTLNSRSK